MLASFFNLGCFSYTSSAGFVSFFRGVFQVLHIPCWLHFFIWGVYLTHPVMTLFFYLESLSDTSRDDFVFIWGVYLTDPVLALILSSDFLLHISCWLQFYQRSFSYTSRAGFIFMQQICLTHPMLLSILWKEFV